MRFVATLLCLLLTPTTLLAEQASVRLTTDNPQVYVGDAIIIDIESTGLVEPLNVEPLKSIATFDRETYGTRIAVVEGKVVENKTRRMEFTADKVGTLIFGPLTGVANNEDVQSNSISISVSEAANEQWSPSDQDLAFEFTLNDHSPYIHQQIVANLVLKHRFPVADEAIILPDFAQFDVVPVYEQRRTLDSSAQSWRLISWRWLLYPKASGQLTLNGPEWAGLMVKSRTQRGNFKLPSETINLAVQAAINPNEWWLPASSVKLDDSWSSPATELSAGDEITRTVTVTATGVLSQQIPDIQPLASRAISSVLINKQREQTLIDETITSKAEFTFRLTAQSPIPVFLDTIRVPWYNTIKNEMSEAIIPARRINVGLPERADVLANLALKRNPWERLKLFVRSMDVNWTLPAMLLALLTASYLFINKSLFTKQFAGRARQQRRIRQVNRAVKNQQWLKAWSLLDAMPAAIHDEADFQTIRAHCDQQLFGQNKSGKTANKTLPTLRLVDTKNEVEHLPPLSI